MPINTPKPLSGAAIDVLWCLFRNGPTWDGNLPSKSGRAELVDLGMVERGDGWQWLTREGIRVCLDRGYDRKKGY